MTMECGKQDMIILEVLKLTSTTNHLLKHTV